MTFCSKVLLIRMRMLLNKSLKKNAPARALMAGGSHSGRWAPMTPSMMNCVSRGKAKAKARDSTAQAMLPAAIPGYGFKYAATRRTTSQVERDREAKVGSESALLAG